MPAGIQCSRRATSPRPRDYGLATWHRCRSVRGIQQRFATITGKGYRPRRIDLGPLRKWAGGAIVGYFLLMVVLPSIVLFYASSQPFFRPSVHQRRSVGVEWGSKTGGSSRGSDLHDALLGRHVGRLLDTWRLYRRPALFGLGPGLDTSLRPSGSSCISRATRAQRTARCSAAQRTRGGRVRGVGWFTVFRQITLRLLVPSLVAGWLWVAIHSGRD